MTAARTPRTAIKRGRAAVGAGAVAAAILAGCGGTSILGVGNPGLEGTAWRATSVAGQAPVPGWEPTLEFAPGQLKGVTGCGVWHSEGYILGDGSYDAGVALMLVELSVESVSCREDMQRVERAFIAALETVDRLVVSEGQLVIQGPAGAVFFTQIDPG